MADEATGNELVENIDVTVQDAEVISYAVDSNLTVAGAAADAKAVGDRFALDEAKTAEDILYESGGEDSIKDRIDDLADNTGSDIAVSATDNTSIANKISTIEGKLYATQIPVSSSAGADTIAEALASQASKTGEEILYASGGNPIKTVVDGIGTRLGTAESSLSALSTTVSGMSAVKYTAQTLSASEQAQARTNIGALSSADAVLVSLQTLTNDQKTQARSNIGAVSIDETVSVNTQTLSAEQQAAVRSNIGLGTAATKAAYNGLDKADEGFVLDARQGGAITTAMNTLSSRVSTAEGKFQLQDITGDVTYDGLSSSNKAVIQTDTLKCYKNGTMCHLQFGLKFSAAQSTNGIAWRGTFHGLPSPISVIRGLCGMVTSSQFCYTQDTSGELTVRFVHQGTDAGTTTTYTQIIEYMIGSGGSEDEEEES